MCHKPLAAKKRFVPDGNPTGAVRTYRLVRPGGAAKPACLCKPGLGLVGVIAPSIKTTPRSPQPVSILLLPSTLPCLVSYSCAKNSARLTTALSSYPATSPRSSPGEPLGSTRSQIYNMTTTSAETQALIGNGGADLKNRKNISQYSKFWSPDHAKDTKQDERNRKDQYESLVNGYYDACTDIYEYGWGQVSHNLIGYRPILAVCPPSLPEVLGGGGGRVRFASKGSDYILPYTYSEFPFCTILQRRGLCAGNCQT